jgi:hypothetical protein
MRFTLFVSALGLAIVGNMTFAGLGSSKEKAACKDCPFPMTISCETAEQATGGDNPFPFKCKILRQHGLRPIKTLQCKAGGDSFPLNCAIEY